MTVLEAIQKSADFLQKKGVDSPRLHAELLLAHVLNLPRMKLYLNFERVLTAPETDNLRELVRRRGTREPLQHIVGSTSFCGFEIAVNRHVLVPRPETELLAEEGWNQLSAINSQPTALDFGTGSGCIAIALAAKVPSAKVYALDVSEEALGLARSNAERNHVSDRITFISGNGFAALRASEGLPRFDLIVSNPPYIPTAEIETLDPEVREFDPRGALDGGPDGLKFYRQLAAEAPVFLNPGGRIMLEFGDGQAQAIADVFAGQKWIVEAIREDYTQRQRILIAYHQPSALSVQRSQA
ncbi:MAG TPA: peptide chain release factor N(5)-glutamine methyltransferase [Candidatus Paceibacterota bacterium]|nr:peptide chain release factor N(5)-glutamine methyltransferase [Candidatus Paceibacterota bacterium]